jgi:hypothetical protein
VVIFSTNQINHKNTHVTYEGQTIASRPINIERDKIQRIHGANQKCNCDHGVKETINHQRSIDLQGMYPETSSVDKSMEITSKRDKKMEKYHGSLVCLVLSLGGRSSSFRDQN